MEKDKDKINDHDIENLISPRCKFSTSPDFMRKVLDEAEKADVGKRKPQLWPIYGATAAVAAVLIAVGAVLFTDNHLDNTTQGANAYQGGADTIARTGHKHIAQDMITDIKPAIPEKKVTPTSGKRKYRRHSAVITVEKGSLPEIESDIAEIPPADAMAAYSDVDEMALADSPVAGPMLCRSKTAGSHNESRQFTTDETDPYLIMTHQAFIDRIRDEIAETYAFINEMRETEKTRQNP